MFYPQITKSILATFLAFAVFASTEFPQNETSKEVPQEELKTFTKDELDAVLVAARFAREMQQTKDVRPLLHKYGGANYGLWISRSEQAFEKEFLSPEFTAKVEPRLVRDLHSSVFNWFYLQSIWDFHQVDDAHDYDLPPEIVKIFKVDPILSKIVDDDSDGDDEKRITSASELARTIKTLEQAATFYRGYLARFPKAKTKTYLANVEDIDDLYHAHEHTCGDDEGCFGLAVGTKYLDVLIEPRYNVVLSRVAGKMKIVYLVPYSN